MRIKKKIIILGFVDFSFKGESIVIFALPVIGNKYTLSNEYISLTHTLSLYLSLSRSLYFEIIYA